MSKTILIVEDELLIAMDLEDALVVEGHNVCVATSGDEGLLAIESGTPIDALVTDIRLPQVNGWAIACRARELMPDLCVIYMSGDSAGEHAAKGVAGSLMIRKPFAVEDFVKVLAARFG